MRFTQVHFAITILLLLGAAIIFTAFPVREAAGRSSQPAVPQYKADPFWPKPLPNNWLVGQVSGVAVDSADHIWIIHRPGTLEPDEVVQANKPPNELAYIPAPPVIEFDQEGNFVGAWGGLAPGYEWPEREHGIFVDAKENIWIGGAGPQDHQVLKFRRDGTFILQIGRSGKTGGSNDKKLLGRPAEFDVDVEANEIYIADGYLNRRIVVFNADTGAYKRHWGAYGNQPDDADIGPYDPKQPPASQFRSPVHAVRLSRDGLLYVCDRNNDRIQVFHKDGRFVKEAFIAKDTTANGTAWDLDFSRDAGQTLLFVPDGTNQRVWIMRRSDLSIVGHFGRSGRNAGHFHWVHSLALDSRGNIYTGEVQNAKRVQKFVIEGKQ